MSTAVDGAYGYRPGRSGIDAVKEVHLSSTTAWQQFIYNGQPH
jgi:hypothetical protein